MYIHEMSRKHQLNQLGTPRRHERCVISSEGAKRRSRETPVFVFAFLNLLSPFCLPGPLFFAVPD